MDLIDASLTTEEHTVLGIVADYIRDHGYSPTVRDVQRRGRFPSSSSTYRVLESLRGKGVLEWQPQVTRTIRLVEKN